MTRYKALTDSDEIAIRSLRRMVEGAPDCQVSVSAGLLWRLIQTAETNATAVTALLEAKSSLHHQRRFGTDAWQHWRNAAARVEGDIEEALNNIANRVNPPELDEH